MTHKDPNFPVSCNKVKDERVKQAPLLCSYRMAIAVLGCLGVVSCYTMRVNLSVAIVCMVNQTAIGNHLDSNASNYIPGSTRNSSCNLNNENSTSKDGPFLWDKELQGAMLGSFYWGYIVTQIPGGWLSERVGSKRVFGFSVIASSLLCLLSPLAARASPWLFISLRLLQGLVQGPMMPAVQNLWAQWAPPLEITKLTSFTYAGCDLGTVVAMSVSGLLCDYGFDGGWPSAFYVFGLVGIVSFILWMIVASDSPSKHPRISYEEKEYIVCSIGVTKKSKYKELGTPWKKLFGSLPVWAVIVANMSASFGIYSLITNIPTFLREVNNFDVKANGGLSALPFIASWVCINIGGWMSDKMLAHGWPVITVRRIMNSTGAILPALLLIAVGHIPCERALWSVVVLTVAVGMYGFSYAGYLVNLVEIAPPFAGTTFGISNAASALAGILAPYAIGVITKDQTQEQWQTVFYLAAAVFIAGNTFFCLFASGEVQEWVKPYLTLNETENTEQMLDTESKADPSNGPDKNLLDHRLLPTKNDSKVV